MQRREVLCRLSALYLASLAPLRDFRSLGDDSDPPDSSRRMQPLVDGNTRFAFDLYNQIHAEPGNLFFSPYSVSTALAMTSAGAAGATARQIIETLSFPENVHPAAAELIGALQGESETRHYELHVANSLWGQRGFEFLPGFLNLLAGSYASELNEVDFLTAAERARHEINRWVEDQTNDRIRELLAPDTVDSMTTLVLVNAIYFKAAWREQFEERLTDEGDFRVSRDQTVQAQFMHQQARLPYARSAGFSALELPYEDNELSMFLLLPDSVDGLPELEESLTSEMLTGVLEELEPRQVQVDLPRFSATSSFELADILSEMGMPDAFSLGTADFTGITRQESLAISRIIHKAFVNVDEAGTEAAAATAVVIFRGGRVEPEIRFQVDRPFLFLIRDHATSSVLFMGRVTNPAQAQ